MSGTVSRAGFTNLLRFRIALYDAAGNSAGQVLVILNVDKTDAYVQEGDTVTLLGKWPPGSEAFNPIIINETARVLVVPDSTAGDLVGGWFF